MWRIFQKKKLAKAFIRDASRAQRLYELSLLDLEDLDHRPFPLRLRYTREQALTAIYQRVVRKFAEEGLRPPRKLRAMVEDECRGV